MEEVVSVGDPQNYWEGHDAANYMYPDFDPIEGLLCAAYDCGANSPNGGSSRLISPAIDFTGKEVLTLSGMFHKRGYGGTSQVGNIDIQISTDNITWTTVGNIDLYDAVNYNGLWQEDSVDISAAAGEPVIYLGFVANDVGYSDIGMDDLKIYESTTTVEYDQTVLVDIPIGEAVDVAFPDWTPDDWQQTSNVDITYVLNACTLMADDNPANDCKAGSATLHYPYVHDVTVVSIDSPTAGGPAQAQDMAVTIKNVGQYEECCFKTRMQVETIASGGTIYDEDFSVNSWTPSHGNWAKSSTSNAGGTSPEYRFYWSPSSVDDFYLVSPPIDTSGFSIGDISFKHYVNDFNGAYDLYFKTSPDGVTWYDAWTVPGGSYGPETIEMTVGPAQGFGSSTFQMAFVFSGDSYNINYWYVDDVAIDVVGSTIVEYYEEFCVPSGTFLEPGEELEIEFDQWIPDDLALGISGEIDYIISAWTGLDVDDNPANDLQVLSITLDYYHDVLVDSITGPSRDPWDLLYSWDLEAATGALGNAGAEYNGDNFYSTRWASNLIHEYDEAGVVTKEFSVPGVTGLRDLAYNPDTGYFYGGAAAGTIWEMDFDSETLVSTISGGFQSRAIAYNPDDDVIYCSNWGDPVWVVDPATGSILDQFNLDTTTSTYGFAYDSSSDGTYLYVFDQTIGAECTVYQWDLDAGAFTGFTYNMGNDFPTISGIAGGLFISDGFVPNNMIIGGLLQGTPDTMAVYELRSGGGGGGPVGIDVWIAPGTHPLEALIGNDGTFPETVDAYAELYEFITNTTNGTLIFDASVGGIALEPLGDTETAAFGTYDFTIQGSYALYVEVPLATDDTPNNNDDVIGIGVDDTPPTSNHAVDPAAPNGANGWYISDVTVTLTGNDGTEPWQSGVDHSIQNRRRRLANR
jgi:hypothetical protein